MALLGEEHIIWLSSAKWSVLNTYVQVTLYALNRLYLGTYMYMYIIYTYIYAIKYNEKKTVNLKEDGEDYMGGFGKRNGKGLKYSLKHKQEEKRRYMKYFLLVGIIICLQINKKFQLLPLERKFLSVRILPAVCPLWRM